MIEKSFKIINQTGLDAKASSALVSLCGKFNSEIKLKSSNITVNLKSIMGVMSLNIHKGEIIEITFSGLDEEEACRELVNIIDNNKIAKEI